MIFITGIFANFFVLESLTVPGDALQTSTNIIENAALFRMGILAFLLMVIVDVLLAWTLYLLLKHAHKELSLLSAWLRLVNGVLFSMALIHLVNILPFLDVNNYSVKGFLESIPQDIMWSIQSFHHTWLLGLVFFGCHLAVLGYLILKSDYIPTILGILLMIASGGYLLDSLANFVLPAYENYQDLFTLLVIVPGIVGEFSLTLWLLIRGVRFQPGNA